MLLEKKKFIRFEKESIPGNMYDKRNGPYEQGIEKHTDRERVLNRVVLIII